MQEITEQIRAFNDLWLGDNRCDELVQYLKPLLEEIETLTYDSSDSGQFEKGLSKMENLRNQLNNWMERADELMNAQIEDLPWKKFHAVARIGVLRVDGSYERFSKLESFSQGRIII